MGDAFTLYGDINQETYACMEFLKKAKIPYRFEYTDNPEDQAALVTPAGTFKGLARITSIFGRRDLESKVKSK